MAFKKTENPKGLYFQMRLTAEDRAALKQKADEHGLSLAEYLIRSGLGRKTLSRVGSNAVVALLEIAREVRALRAAQPLELDDQLMDILNRITDAIDRVGKLGL